MTDRSPERLSEDQNWVRSTQVDRRAAILGSAVLTGYALAAQPVAASAITTDVTGLDAGMTSFQTAGLRMNAYRAKPSGKRNLPVVIVVQEIFGLHEWVKDICRRYAKAGFYAIAPDLYQRQGDATKIADFKVLIGDIVSKVPDAQVMGDLDAVAQFAGTARTNFFNWLYTSPYTGNTPTLSSVIRSGEFFRRSGSSALNPYWDTTRSRDLMCRQNFHVLVTDGYWNQTSHPSNSTAGANSIKANKTLPDGKTQHYVDRRDGHRAVPPQIARQAAKALVPPREPPFGQWHPGHAD